MLLIVKHSRGSTSLPAFACTLGICAGLIVHISLSMMGIAALLAASTNIYRLVKVAGALYLVYIGVMSLLSRGSSIASSHSIQPSPGFSLAFRDGFLCNVLNPKVTIFVLAVFTQIIAPDTPTFQKLVFSGCIVLESFVVWNLFSIFIRSSFVLPFVQKFQVVIDRTVGVLLIIIGTGLCLDSES